jgi:RimJ/RimL family protein N-acetyltransferase
MHWFARSIHWMLRVPSSYFGGWTVVNVRGYRREFTTRKGRRVLFRPLQEGESVEEFLRFINGLVDEDTFISMTRRLSREGESQWLSERLQAIDEGRGLAILVLHGERIVANAGVDRRGGRSGHVGGLGIAVSRGFRDEGIGTELLKEVVALARDFLEVRVIVLHVFGNSERAIRVYRRMGFEECGRIPGAVFYGGEYVDDVLMYLDLGEWGSVVGPEEPCG